MIREDLHKFTFKTTPIIMDKFLLFLLMTLIINKIILDGLKPFHYNNLATIFIITLTYTIIAQKKWWSFGSEFILHACQLQEFCRQDFMPSGNVAPTAKKFTSILMERSLNKIIRGNTHFSILFKRSLFLLLVEFRFI